MRAATYLPLVAAVLQLRQPAGAVLGAVPVNTSATEAAATGPTEYHPPPDVAKVLELACRDQRFVSLALDNWTAVGADLAAAFAKIAAVPATRFRLVTEMESPAALRKPRPRVLLQQRQRVPVLYFFQVEITPGRPAECPCPCIPGTPAAQVAETLLAALGGQVDGFSFAARAAGVWKGKQTFPAPAVVPKPARAVPTYDDGVAMPQSPQQAWAFSNATRGVVDDFMAEQEGSVTRAAEALGKAERAQIPCTRTNGGLPGPCIFPGKIAAEIPVDQQGYPQQLPWTDPITYPEGVAPIV